jgi:hypothetical protein
LPHDFPSGAMPGHLEWLAGRAGHAWLARRSTSCKERTSMPDHDVNKAQNNVQDAKQERRDALETGDPREIKDARQEVHEEKHDLRQERREDHKH